MEKETGEVVLRGVIPKNKPIGPFLERIKFILSYYFPEQDIQNLCEELASRMNS